VTTSGGGRARSDRFAGCSPRTVKQARDVDAPASGVSRRDA
jgi:hypothetical protein